MHAVVIRARFNDRAAAMAELEGIVSQVSGMPGFVSGHWVAVSPDEGSATIAFESADDAEALANMVRTAPSPTVTTVSVEVGEVVARA
jgi:hypothetical protein